MEGIIMPISQIRELRLSGTVAAQVTQLCSKNLHGVQVWLVPGLCPPTVSRKCPWGTPNPPYIYHLGSVSSLFVPLSAHVALAFSELIQGLKWANVMLIYWGAFRFMKPFPSSALLTTPTPRRLCMAPSSSFSLQLCHSEGHIKY